MRIIGALVLVVACLGTLGRAEEAAVEGVASLYGEAQVMKFRDGKIAAFSMQFDDSMETHAKFVIPELNKRGLVGTFFVNPGGGAYQQNREVWEVVCPKFGHELANHTMNHHGAKDLEEADYEIGECSRIIWKLYPNESKLRPYMSGGGSNVKWGISREERQQVRDKYFCFWGSGGSRRVSVAEERGNGRAVVLAEQALEERKWGQVGFHGVGGEWISTSEEHFLELVDYLVANRDKIWTGTTGDLFRYNTERDAVTAVRVTDASETGFKVAIECDETKAKTYDAPFVELYDEPLTVRVSVPDSWSRFTVTQQEDRRDYEAVDVDGVHYAQFDVRPNVEPAAVAVMAE